MQLHMPKAVASSACRATSQQLLPTDPSDTKAQTHCNPRAQATLHGPSARHCTGCIAHQPATWLVTSSVAAPLERGTCRPSHAGACRWVSLIGALMSLCYSTIAAGASIAAVQGSASYGPRPESPADQTFGIMNAVGGILFAFGGHAVLLEIQACPCALCPGAASPPSSWKLSSAWCGRQRHLACWAPWCEQHDRHAGDGRHRSLELRAWPC